MSRVFQPYQIKYHAKKAMRGNFLKALGGVGLPTVIITALSLCVLFIPAVRESLEVILSGSFASSEAQADYISEVYSNLIYTTSLVLALFNFLIIGGESICLDIVKGKETSVKNIFRFYDRWYIALVWPLVTFLLGFGADELLEYMYNANVNEYLIEIFVFVYELAILFITFKTVFIPQALADGECKNFFDAFKTSWKLTNFKTILSIFLLYISFIGWFLIIMFAFFPIIYVYPYLRMCMATLYQTVKETAELNTEQ